MFIKKFIEYDPGVNAGTINLQSSCSNRVTAFQLDANQNIILSFGKDDDDYYLTDIELLDFDYMLPLKLMKLINTEIKLITPKGRRQQPYTTCDDTEVELEFVYDKITDKAILYLDDQSVEILIR